MCAICKQSFWGIGYQGLVCQKSKCEMRVHRYCAIANAASPTIGDCAGNSRSIIKNSIREMLSIRPRETTQSKFYEKAPSTIPTQNEDPNTHRMEDTGVLPVKVAISKYEQMNNKQSNGTNSPPLQASSMSHQTSMQRLFSPPVPSSVSPSTSQTMLLPSVSINTQMSTDSSASVFTTTEQPSRYFSRFFFFDNF